MHPGKGATLSILPAVYDDVVSIHAPWEGCDLLRPWLSHPHVQVSIHAPWEGCDQNHQCYILYTLGFNSRTLGRVRLGVNRWNLNSVEFQFTHPGKGATSSSNATGRRVKGFNSRTLGRVRRRRSCARVWHSRFNSRTLGRVRHSSSTGECGALTFQFTHPGKGATISSKREMP